MPDTRALDVPRVRHSLFAETCLYAHEYQTRQHQGVRHSNAHDHLSLTALHSSDVGSAFDAF